MLKKVIMSDLGEIYTGNTPSKKNNEYYESNDIMFIKPDIMSFDIENIEESNEYISENARDKARIVPANSLLVSCIGNIGKLAINKEEASFNQQINAIVHNENIVSSKYLAYLLKYNQKRLEAIANAPVVPIINKTQFSNFEVSIHESLEIQNKIAEVLDKAQELIDKRKEQIEALDELVKSRFIEMFGDPYLNPKGFNIVKMTDITSVVTCGVAARPEYVANGIPFLSSQNVGMREIFLDEFKFISEDAHKKLTKHNKPEKGDILYTRVGSQLGKAAIVNLDFEFSVYVSLTLIKPLHYKVNNEYLVNYLNLDSVQKFAKRNTTGIGVPNLNVDVVRKYNIPLPPIELQNQFADFVKQVDKLKSQMETSLKELEDNFNSLMQKAFKGELF